MPIPALETASVAVETTIPLLGEADGDLEGSTVETAAPSIARFHVASRELVLARSALDSRFAASVMGRGRDHDTYVGEGFALRRRGGMSRKAWDDEALRSAVHERVMGRAEDRDDVWRLLSGVFRLGGGSVRARALRDLLDLNPDLYCTSERGGWRLEVVQP